MFAKRKKTINEPKNTRSRASTTPREIASKCVKKLNDAMASVTTSGAQALKKSCTVSNPDSRNRKHITMLTTNAMTWFFVSAETNEPIARKPPAIRKLPK